MVFACKNMTNPRKQTFQESGQMLYPYKSFPSSVKCVKHDYEVKVETFGNKFLQCKKCYQAVKYNG